MVRCYHRPAVGIAYAIFGIVVGISAGVAFGPVLQNPSACAFCFFSGAVAALCLAVHIAYLKGTWTRESHDGLSYLLYTGWAIQIIGVIAFIVYIVLGVIYQRDKLHIIGPSYFLASVWCFITWKWAFVLSRVSRRYRFLISTIDDYDAPILE